MFIVNHSKTSTRKTMAWPRRIFSLLLVLLVALFWTKMTRAADAASATNAPQEEAIMSQGTNNFSAVPPTMSPLASHSEPSVAERDKQRERLAGLMALLLIIAGWHFFIRNRKNLPGNRAAS